MIALFEKGKTLEVYKFILPFLIFIGCLKLILFYSFFGIRIVDYLEITEVLISFLDNIISIVFFIFLPILIILSFWGKAIGDNNQIEYLNKSKLSFYERLKIDFKENYVLLIINIIFVIVILMFGKIDYRIVILLACNPGFYIIFFIIRELRITYKKQYDYTIPATYLNLFTLAYLFVVIIIQNTLEEIREINENNIYQGTVVYLEKEVIKCDSIITYVGQTKNYIFLYNRKSKQSIIIPKAKLEKLVINKKS